MLAKKFDTEAFLYRLTTFAKRSHKLVRALSKTDGNRIYGAQFIRSSSSPGANYIEALEAESKKDFVHRLRICRKETRESIYWLDLIKDANRAQTDVITVADSLIAEATELVKVFTASLFTLEKN